jgi:hypothetical protein
VSIYFLLVCDVSCIRVYFLIYRSAVAVTKKFYQWDGKT